MLIFGVISVNKITVDCRSNNIDHGFIKDAYSLNSVNFMEIGHWKEQILLPLEAYHFNSMEVEFIYQAGLYSC